MSLPFSLSFSIPISKSLFSILQFHLPSFDTISNRSRQRRTMTRQHCWFDSLLLIPLTPFYFYQNWLIGQVDRVFANGLGDLGSIPGRVIPKTLKMELDTSLLNTQQYKVCIKGKVEQSRERSSTLPYTSV